MLTDVSYQELDEKLSEFWRSNAEKRCLDRRIPVVVDPQMSWEMLDLEGIYFPVKKIEEKILLGIFQWYTHRELGVQIYLWLEEHWGPEHLDVKAMLLDTKETALGWLLIQDRWSSRDFFGNVLKKENLRNILRFKYLRSSCRPRPRKTQRHRGYNDKGTLRPQHRSLSYDYRKLRSYDEQLEVERQLEESIDELFQVIQIRLTQENVV